MIAEILPEIYDIGGQRVLHPEKKNFKFFSPKYPLGRHLMHPLLVRCRNFKEIRGFLKHCRYVSDQKHFGIKDYWMPPEEFERDRHGDCEDFALWVWRQLISIGKEDPRFVTGLLGPKRKGHAWVTYRDNGRAYLMETTTPRLSRWMPRLRTLHYTPYLSAGWDGRQVVYFEHQPLRFTPSPIRHLLLRVECLLYWIKTRPAFYFTWTRYFVFRFFGRSSSS